MSRRPRPQLLSLTPAAAEQLRVLISGREDGFLRLGVRNGGCSGMEYFMEHVASPGENDERVCDLGVELLVDAAAILFLIGSRIDYEVTPLHSKFVFDNPNQTDACGCGESVSLVPAQISS